MTDKDLKKLTRKQLLELLLEQTERADHLQTRLLELTDKLTDRTLIETSAGSMAKAALELSGVFEAADNAAAQYLANIKRLNDNAEEDAYKRAKVIIDKAKQEAKEERERSEKRIAELTSQIGELEKRKKMLENLFKDFYGETNNDK